MEKYNMRSPKEKEKITDSILYKKPFEINYKTITWEEYQEVQRKEKKLSLVAEEFWKYATQIHK